jgi:hypothetical protein
MPGTIKRIGPLALTATLTTNVYNQSSALIYDILKSVTLVNKTAGAVTVTLYIGATGANTAGTEILVAHSVPANSEYTFYPNVKMASTDFLVGGASAGTSITLYGTTEQYVV